MTVVREATEADFEPLTKLDLTYTVGNRYLELSRSGRDPEVGFSLGWRDGESRERVYATLTVDGLRGALRDSTDAFFVAEVDGAVAGYMMIVLPRWTNAAEITDLAVDRRSRRSGAGRALVDAAVAWARERGLRAVWVEPRGEAGDTISFYLALGFRVRGVNDAWNSNEDGADGRQTLFMYREIGSSVID